MSVRHRPRSERDQLELFRALPGDLAPRDAQDLMTYPFFSLAKTHRVTPIDFRMNDIAIRVEAVAEHGMATIWDADVLIWAASQIVEARDAGLRTSRLMAARPREILTFTGRGTSARDYHRLKAALQLLQPGRLAQVGIDAGRPGGEGNDLLSGGKGADMMVGHEIPMEDRLLR